MLKTNKKMASSLDRSKFKKTDLKKHTEQKDAEYLQKISKLDLSKGIVLSISPEGIVVSSEKVNYLCTLRGVLKKEKGSWY